MSRNTRLRGAAVAALTALASTANAQTAQYLQSQTSATYRGITARGLTGDLVIGSADNGQAAVDLPFTFDFLGTDFDRILIDPAGFIHFSDTAPPAANRLLFDASVQALPSTVAPNDIIALFWASLPTNKQVHVATEGVAPNRIFYIEYTRVNFFAGLPAIRASFMVALHEGLGKFEVSYDDELSAPRVGSVEAVAGYESSGASADPSGAFAPCTTTSSCDASDYQDRLVGQVFSVARAERIDLAIADLVAPPGAFPGSTVTATLTVRNNGILDAEGVDLSLHLSTDDVVDATDREVATIVDAFDLAAGATVEPVVAFVLPADVAPNQRFFLYAEVDPNDEFEESFEDDNILITPDPNFATGYDFGISGCRVLTPPNLIIPGAELSFEVLLDNRGVPATDPIDVELWASVDGRLDRDDDLAIAVVSTGPLSANPQSTLELRAALPAQDVEPGVYFPACVADAADAVAEVDENNTFVAPEQDRFVIRPVPLTLVEDALPEATVGVEYRYEIQVNGGTFADRSELDFEGSGAPSGLRVTSDGVIEGVPEQPTGDEGVTLNVIVRDGNEIDRGAYTLVVNAAPPLTLAGAALPAAQLGVAYSAQIAAEGGRGDLSYAVASGALPAGVRLTIDGTVSGVPTEAGDFGFDVLVRDTPAGGGEPQEARAAFTLQVVGSDFGFTTTSLPDATVGEAYAQSIQTSGGVSPIIWRVQPGTFVPDGLSAEPSGDTLAFDISGVPTRASARPFVVVATDGAGRVVEQTFTITVRAAPEPTCPGDPDCPATPVASDESGCSATAAPGCGVWMLALGAALLLQRRRRRRDKSERLEPRSPSRI